MESSNRDSCVVILNVLGSDLSASPQNEKQKQDKRQKVVARYPVTRCRCYAS